MEFSYSRQILISTLQGRLIFLEEHMVKLYRQIYQFNIIFLQKPKIYVANLKRVVFESQFTQISNVTLSVIMLKNRLSKAISKCILACTMMTTSLHYHAKLGGIKYPSFRICRKIRNKKSAVYYVTL